MGTLRVVFACSVATALLAACSGDLGANDRSAPLAEGAASIEPMAPAADAGPTLAEEPLALKPEPRQRVVPGLLIAAPTTGAFATVQGLCRAVVRDAHRTLSARVREARHELSPGVPSCKELARLPFVPSGDFRSLHAIRVDDGVAASSQLVVELARGFVTTGVAWDLADPLDPGCGSIVRPEALIPLRVEGRHLVASLVASRLLYQEPPASASDPEGSFAEPLAERAHFKFPVWCADEGGTFGCRSMDLYEAPVGVLLPKDNTNLAPLDVTWPGEAPFFVGSDGALVVIDK